VLERQGSVEIWGSSDLPAADDRAGELDRAIDEADVAVLLISPSFLASEPIMIRELPGLLERHLPVIPILMRPCMWSAVPEIAGLRFANDTAQPLSSASEQERDRVYLSVAQRIAELVEAIAERSEAQPVTQPEALTFGIGPQYRGLQLGPRAVNGGHLFVSHAREDGDFAELLKLRLEREGHDAWIDTDRLDPGLDWRTEIDQAIKDASALLAIMSPDGRASEYVTYEWAFAWGNGTKVIPIMLRQTPLHPRLATLQYLDFTNRNARPWRRLLELLSRSEGPSRGED
jgi:hypothetical protein